MRAVVQRVSRAAVDVDGRTVASIGKGLLVLVGVAVEDTAEDARYLAEKVAQLRIFADESGKLNRSVQEVGGEVLAVSQFTLYGDCSRGRRPSFTRAAKSEDALPLYREFVETLRREGVPVQEGVFGATMAVSLVNDGPVTLIVESR